MSEILKGRVKFYNEEKGFGFIQCEGGDFFYHVTNVIGTVKKDDNVTFEPKEGKRGMNAINVRKAFDVKEDIKNAKWYKPGGDIVDNDDNVIGHYKK